MKQTILRIMGGRNASSRPLFIIFILFVNICLINTSPDLCFADNSTHEELLVLNNQDQPIFSAALDSRCGFAITYRHSVALTPVTDYFFIRNNSIYLDKTIYQDFGAGLPHSIENNQIMHQHDGVVEIKNFDLCINEFTLRVGRVADHKLILLKYNKDQSCVPGRIIKLSEIARPGSAITFKAKR